MNQNNSLESTQKRVRPVVEIFETIKLSLQAQSKKLVEVFFDFDVDGDTYLNQNEFVSFLNSFDPSVSETEQKSVLAYMNNYQFSKFLVSLYQLTQLIKDDPLLIDEDNDSSIKDFFKNYNQINQQQQKPQISNSISNQLDEQYYKIDHPKAKGIKEFVTLFETLSQSKAKFEDKDFPPNQKSLGDLDMRKHKGGQIVWKRPEDFPQQQGKSNKWELFVSDGVTKISPEDIVQGELGDCYLLAALSSIANKVPQSIDDLYITKKTNQFGIYAVFICIEGIWQAVYVDDYFPCYKNTGPIFCSSKDQELWVMVLEKAWAKAFGSYNNIIAGQPAQVMRVMTGGVTWNIKTEADNFEEQFKKGIEDKCVMCSGTRDVKDIEQVGFIVGHAYSVLKIYDDPEIQTKDKNLKLVKLRNPWGEKEWSGNWSDNSNLWTPALKEKYKLVNRNDGVFYMSMVDFKNYFESIDMLYFRDYYKYQSYQVQPKAHHAMYFDVDVQKKGEYFFSVIQEHSRSHSTEVYQYSNVRMALGQGEQSEQFGMIQSDQQEMWMKLDLKNRKYVLYVKVDWFDQKPRNIVIVTYSDNIVQMKQTEKVPNLLNSIMLAKAKQKNEWATCKPGVLKSYDFKNSENGFGYYIIDNQSKKPFELILNVSKSIGLKWRKPEKGDNFKFKLAPSETKVLVAKMDYYESKFSASEGFK